MLARAISIPTKLRLKDLSSFLKYKKLYQSNYEVIFEYTANRYVILYSFGACVLINMPPKDTLRVIQKLQNRIPEFTDFGLDETYRIKIIPDSDIKIVHTHITLPEFKLEYIKILSLILAESVAIESYEQITEAILLETAKYSDGLRSKGVYPTRQKELLKFIGFCISVRQDILSNLYIVDNPDETWNSPILEKMYLKLKDQFDIEPRYRSLNMALNSIQESIELMVNLLQARKSNALELWIIALIAFEIIMSLLKLV